MFIEGKPGSGKSTLVRYFTDHLPPDGAIVAKFFYSHRDGELERDHRSMLQSLLYDILKADESFFIHFQQPYRNHGGADRDLRTAGTGTSGPSRTWPYETLKTILRACRTHPLKRKLVLIVDAMDESDSADRADIVQFLWDLSVSADKDCVVKVFLASRPLNEFHRDLSSRCKRVLLQERNRKDIEYYTDAFLQDPVFHSVQGVRNQAKDYIVQNADGVFLWVHLVRQSLVRFARNGSSPRKLLNLLESLPKGLESYYKYMLERLSGSDKHDCNEDDSHKDDGDLDDIRDGMRILQFCLFSHRPIQLAELGHALAIPGDILDEPLDLSWEDDKPNVHRRLTHCVGGFVEIRKSPASGLDGKSLIPLEVFVRLKLIILSS